MHAPLAAINTSKKRSTFQMSLEQAFVRFHPWKRIGGTRQTLSPHLGGCANDPIWASLGSSVSGGSASRSTLFSASAPFNPNSFTAHFKTRFTFVEGANEWLFSTPLYSTAT